MMNPAWLLLIIPLSASVGFVLAGIFFGSENDPDNPENYR